MYSFVSTNDFGHKTGYVSRISRCVDWTANNDFYPLDQMYEFDNLFARFASEINYAIDHRTSFDTQNLYICKSKSISSGTVTSSYVGVRLTVSSTEIRVYIGSVTSRTSSLSSYKACPIQDYLDGTHKYNYGRIYLVELWYYSNSGGYQSDIAAGYMNGDVEGYIGTYQAATSSYPYGRMKYTFSAYTIPHLLPVGTMNQTGVPDSAANRANQPEIVGKVNYYGLWSENSKFCSASGEYDPDPTPPGPGPGPGPTPSSDPNYDPNIEPGDNPDPSPGPHNRTYDPIPIPGLPTVTAVGAGFTTLYNPSEAILRLLASELYSDNVIQIISNFFSDPYDMIAGLSIVPFTVPVSGRAKHRIGLFESDIAMSVISNQFVTINCGDILIEPYYNSFLDHSPYTRLILWLPYIGYQEIDPDEIMGQMLNITYHCDCLSGACTAFVNSGVVGETGPQIPRVIAQFSGNCSVQIPTAAASYDNLIASSINILTTAVSAGVGQVSAAASMATMQSDSYTQEDLDAVHAKSAVSGGQSLIGCAGDVVRAMKPTVTRNGTPGSSAGYMGVQKPYLIKIVPRNSIPDDNAFMAIKGYPSNKTGTLSEYSGFCTVEDIQLNNVPATIGEINEIYDLLKGGVIL